MFILHNKVKLTIPPRHCYCLPVPCYRLLMWTPVAFMLFVLSLPVYYYMQDSHHLKATDDERRGLVALEN